MFLNFNALISFLSDDNLKYLFNIIKNEMNERGLINNESEDDYICLI